MMQDNMNRREFATTALAAVGAALCPCALLANPPRPGAKRTPQKEIQYSLINANVVACGTCQHWKGKRQLVEQGRRVKCQSIPTVPCFRGSGFKYPPMSSAASHGCVGKFYKRWSSLP